MNKTQNDNLVKMLNQIVSNNMHHDNAAEVAANHVRRFWARSMKRCIIAHSKDQVHGLIPDAKRAVELLAGDD
jgi:formate dehydrogenase subunit delta